MTMLLGQATNSRLRGYDAPPPPAINAAVRTTADLTDSTGFLIPQVRTFSSLYNTFSNIHSYRWDEAIRYGREFANAMHRDAFLRSLEQERIAPLTGWKWDIEPDPDENDLVNPKDPYSVEREHIGKQLKAIIGRTPGFIDMRRYHGLSAWFGRYGAQVHWAREKVAGEWRFVVDRHVPIDGDKIAFGFDGTPGVMIRPGDAGYWPDVRNWDGGSHLAMLSTRGIRQRFIIQKFFIEDGDFWDGQTSGRVEGIGYRDFCYWAWWLRDTMLSWLTDFMEKVGHLGLLLFYYEEGNPTAKAAAELSAKNTSGKSALAVPIPKGKDPKTAGVELIPANMTGVQFLKEIVGDYFERHIERLIVGQSMSGGADNDSGLGGSGRAALAKDTKWHLLRWDAEKQQDCYTHEFVAVAKELNFRDAPWRYSFRYALPDPEADAKLSAVAKAAGLPGKKLTFRADEVRGWIGATKPDEGDEIVGGDDPPPGMAGVPGQPGGPTPIGPDGQPLPAAGPGAPGAVPGAPGQPPQTPGMAELVGAMVHAAADGDWQTVRELRLIGMDTRAMQGVLDDIHHGRDPDEPEPTPKPKVTYESGRALITYEWTRASTKHGHVKAVWSGGGERKPLYGERAEAALRAHDPKAAAPAPTQRGPAGVEPPANAKPSLGEVRQGYQQIRAQNRPVIQAALEDPASVQPQQLPELALRLTTMTKAELRRMAARIDQTMGAGLKIDVMKALLNHVRGGKPAAGAAPIDPNAPEAPESPASVKDRHAERAEATAAHRDGGGGPLPGLVHTVPVGDLSIDPGRFQFKLKTNAEGVTDELKGVQKWNPDFAGVISVWRDPADGKTYVVNGHHRYELAKRLGVKDLAVRYLDAKDAKQARAKGALINIAEGRGTAIDAAKFMRDTGVTVDDFAKHGVSLKSGALADNAQVLTGLSDKAFNQLTAGDLDLPTALAVGKHLTDHARQDRLFKMLQARADEGKPVAPRSIEEMARTMASVHDHTTTQQTLWGPEEHTEDTFAHRADLSAHVRAELAKEFGDFSAVSSERRAGRVGEAGNVLNTAENAKRAEAAGHARNLYNLLSNRKGAIGEALNQGAVELAAATTEKERKSVRAKHAAAVRDAVHRELAATPDATGEGGAVRGAERPPEPAPAGGADGAGGQAAVPSGLTPPAEDGAAEAEPDFDAKPKPKPRPRPDGPQPRPMPSAARETEPDDEEPAAEEPAAAPAAAPAAEPGADFAELFHAAHSKGDQLALHDLSAAALRGEHGPVHRAKVREAVLANAESGGGFADKHARIAAAVGKPKPKPAAAEPERDTLNLPGGQLDMFGGVHKTRRPSPAAEQQSLVSRDMERQADAEDLAAGLDKMKAAGEAADAAPPAAAAPVAGDEPPADRGAIHPDEPFPKGKPAGPGKIEQMPGLTDEERAIETKAAARALNSYDALKAEYLKANGTPDDKGGHRSIVLNTDDWRDLFAEDGYNGTNAQSVHEPASHLNNRLLDEAIAGQAGKGNNQFLVLAGGGGSGKGTATKSFFDQREYPVVLDQVSDNLKKLEAKLDRAKAAGFTPAYTFVDRPPEAAWDGVVGRAMVLRAIGKPARTVPADMAINANIAARRTALELLKKRPDLNANVIDNTTGEAGSRRMIVDRDEAIAHLERRLAEDEKAVAGGLHSRAVQGVLDRHHAGEIPRDIARGLIGHAAFDKMTGGGEPNADARAVSGPAPVPADDAAGPKPEPAAPAGRPQSGRVGGGGAGGPPAEPAAAPRDGGVAGEAGRGAPGSVDDYVGQAMGNLRKTSRTAGGVVDTSASKAKADKIVDGLTPAAAAKAANDNFEQVVRGVHAAAKTITDKSPANVTTWADNLNQKINAGITKEGVLLRTDNSTKFPYTDVAHLPLAREQFAQEFLKRLNDPTADPVETAAWVEWRVNLTDHAYADGVGKTSKALAMIPLMRAGLPLPNYPDNKTFFANGAKHQYDPRDGSASYLDGDWEKFRDFYKGLMPNQPATHAEVANTERLDMADGGPPIFRHTLAGGRHHVMQSPEGFELREQVGHGPGWSHNRGTFPTLAAAVEATKPKAAAPAEPAAPPMPTPAEIAQHAHPGLGVTAGELSRIAGHTPYRPGQDLLRQGDLKRATDIHDSLDRAVTEMEAKLSPELRKDPNIGFDRLKGSRDMIARVLGKGAKAAAAAPAAAPAQDYTPVSLKPRSIDKSGGTVGHTPSGHLLVFHPKYGGAFTLAAHAPSEGQENPPIVYKETFPTKAAAIKVANEMNLRPLDWSHRQELGKLSFDDWRDYFGKAKQAAGLPPTASHVPEPPAEDDPDRFEPFGGPPAAPAAAPPGLADDRMQVSTHQAPRHERKAGLQGYRAFASTNDGGFLSVDARGDSYEEAERKARADLRQKHAERSAFQKKQAEASWQGPDPRYTPPAAETPAAAPAQPGERSIDPGSRNLGPEAKANWTADMVAQGHTAAEADAAWEEAVRAGVDPLKSDNLASLEQHMNALDEIDEPPVDPDKAPHLTLSDAIGHKLKAGTLTAKELFALADEHHGGTRAEGKYGPSQAYDSLEAGFNKAIRGQTDPTADLADAQQQARDLADKVDALPTQTNRSGKKDSHQQFSTPPHFAFAANWVANLNPDDVVLEPSAGTGSLAVHAKNAGAQVVANEIDAERLDHLRDQFGAENVHAENAEQIGAILPGRGVRPTAVVMNPPFSQTAGRMGDKKELMTGARHIDEALRTLPPGGRLVAIVAGGTSRTGGHGSGMSPDSPFYRDWFNKLKEKHSLRANVGVAGSEYKKYGTNFGTRLLVIDKTGPHQGETVVGDAEDVPDLMAKLEGVRNDRPRVTGGASGQPAGGPTAQGSGPAGGPAADAAGAAGPVVPADGGEPGDVPLREPVGGTQAGGGPAEPAKPGGGGGDAAAGPGGAGGAAGVGGGERQLGGAVGPAGRAADGDAGGKRKRSGKGAGRKPVPGAVVALPQLRKPELVNVQPISRLEHAVRAAADGPSPAAGEGPGGSAPNPDAEPKEDANADLGASLYEQYRPAAFRVPNSQPHASPLVESAAMAAVRPPEATYKPMISPDVIEGGQKVRVQNADGSTTDIPIGISEAGLESVIYAGQAHEQYLPAAEQRPGDATAPPAYRRGYFIGDGTGAGKGRQIAGIMTDNWNRDRKKHVWVSQKWKLLNDAKRDWRDVGNDPQQIHHFDKIRGSATPPKEGIAFITYDTLKGRPKDKSLPTNLDQLVNWVGKDFDGVIAFDEAHSMSNGMEQEGERGAKDASQRALAGIELQKRLPHARIVYVSATGATEVANLAYAERLGLWGRGTAFPTKQEFVNQMNQGGVAAMEAVAQSLKATGSYAARSLSYDGVTYDRLTHDLTPDQHEIYNTLADGWQKVLQNINEALEITGGAKNGNEASAAKSMFWGAQQRFFNQLMTSMQTPTVIGQMQKDMDEGRAPVVQLVNTMEAATERARARLEDDEDLEAMDVSPREVLMQYLEKGFPVHRFEEYVDENGNTRTRLVLDAAGKPVEDPEAVAKRDELLTMVGTLRIPESPLDLIINHFGHDKVAEATGRKQRLVYKTGPDGTRAKEWDRRPDSANQAETDAFQSGRKKAMIFSDAGGTGASYHADRNAKNQAQRTHYLLQPGWRADNAVQGLGRTHRTNQATPPTYRLVQIAQLPAQRRFISTIARRLDQLGALTRGQRQAGGGGLFAAADNLESPQAKEAMDTFFRDVKRGNVPDIDHDQLITQLGLKKPDKDEDRNRRRSRNKQEEEVPESMGQFLNRLLSLRVDMQQKVFDGYDHYLKLAVERAINEGSLDTGVENYPAQSISKVSDKVVHKDPGTGAEARLLTVKAREATKARPWSANQEGFQKPLGYVTNKTSGRLWAVYKGGSKTDPTTGNVTNQYKLVGPGGTSQFKPVNDIDPGLYGWERPGRPSSWEKAEEADAKTQWDKEYAETPQTSESDQHFLTGAFLPIWDKIPGGDKPKIYRLRTDDGQTAVGRHVPAELVDLLHQNLGIQTEGKTYDAGDTHGKVEAGRARARLTNGWVLKPARVQNERRVEVDGVTSAHLKEFQSDGGIVERIGYQTRFFIPTGEAGRQVLARVLKSRNANVASVVDLK